MKTYFKNPMMCSKSCCYKVPAKIMNEMYTFVITSPSEMKRIWIKKVWESERINSRSIG